MTTAAALAASLRAGRLDALDALAAVWDRLAGAGDPAIYTKTLPARAEAEARAARERLRAGLPASCLDGVPVAWKANFDLRGEVTTAGSRVLEGPPAGQDAAVVGRVARAGCLATGLLNMTEFAYSGLGLNPHFGTPRNPCGGAHRVPGGSSSGAGVAVAAGVVPLAFGTDTGGSIRIPAALNGVVGYKASAHRYPMAGVFPLSRRLDSLGPLAGTVEDCILADAVMRGLAAPSVEPAAPTRVIVADGAAFAGIDPAVGAAFEAAARRIAAAGVAVEHRAVPEIEEAFALAARYGTIHAPEAFVLHRERVTGPQAALMDQRVVRRVLAAGNTTAADLLMLLDARPRLMAALARTCADGAVIALPTTARTAMEVAPLEADPDLFTAANVLMLRNTAVGNYLDACAVSIPCGADADGMPVGLMLMSSRGRDDRLLAAALALEPLIRG